MKIKKILKTIWNEFIYGGHLQSLGSSSIIFLSANLLKINITWDILLISYLISYAIYLFNRFKEIEIDYLTNPQRTNYLKTYIYHTPIIISFVIFVIIGALIYFSNFWALIFGLFLILFGFFYTIFFKKLTKRIILFKNFYVSIAFSLMIPFLIIYYLYPLTNILIISSLILIIFVYCKAFMMQILLDVKDIESDKKEGLLTFPVVFGKEKTLNILKIISILSTAPILLIYSLYFNIFPISILILLLTIPFNFYCFKLARQKNYFGYILGSGEFLFWSVLILISKFVL